MLMTTFYRIKHLSEMKLIEYCGPYWQGIQM
jgi:hypothetical protein